MAVMRGLSKAFLSLTTELVACDQCCRGEGILDTGDDDGGNGSDEDVTDVFVDSRDDGDDVGMVVII